MSLRKNLKRHALDKITDCSGNMLGLVALKQQGVARVLWRESVWKYLGRCDAGAKTLSLARFLIMRTMRYTV